MPHPVNADRMIEHTRNRVSSVLGHAKGGAAKHSDAAEDRQVVKAMVKRSALLPAAGTTPSHRMDRPGRAKGGRVRGKHAKTIVNVIAGHPGPIASPAAMAGPQVAPVPMPPPAAMPPRPPMAPPGVAPPGMMPPGMPPRRQGGRVRGYQCGGIIGPQMSGPTAPGLGPQMSGVTAPGLGPQMSGVTSPAPAGPMMPTLGRYQSGQFRRGGAVKPGPAYNEGLKAGTQVQHSGNKKDGADIGRGKVITYNRGGRVSDRNGSPMHQKKASPPYMDTKPPGRYASGGRISAPADGRGPKLPGGSGGGQARLAKEARAAKGYAKPAKGMSNYKKGGKVK